MKRFSIALTVAVLLMAGMLPAAHAAIEVTGDVYAGVYDKYLWRGFDLSGGQPVLQAGADVSFKGFTASYWTNIQLSAGGGEPSNEVTETDIVLDYTLEVDDLLSLSVGDIFYNFNGADETTHELYLGGALNTLLAPALTVYYDWDLANSLDLDGLYYTATVGHTIPLGEKVGINLGALLSYNQESPYVGDYSEFHNYELSASADWALTEQVSLTPSILYSSPISDEAKEAIDSQWLAGLNLTLTF